LKCGWNVGKMVVELFKRDNYRLKKAHEGDSRCVSLSSASPS
jgi:hypothetical protein